MAWFDPALALAILWFGALVLVPLALGLHGPAGKGARPLHNVHFVNRSAFRSVGRLVVPAALLLVAATVFEGDWRVRLALALPWVALTVVCAAIGLWRILNMRRSFPRPSGRGWIADWGLVLFAVSGFSAGAYAAGHELFGFPLIIVLLTAIHQMYAGLILQTIAACIATAQPGRFSLFAALGVTLGNPAVALGITATHLGAPPIIEFIAVCFYATCVILLGWVQLYLAFRPGLPPLSRVLLVISELALGTALILAIIFAWGTARGWPTLTIPQMIFWHGILNAFGFALPALIGWTLARRPVPTLA